ncbi:dimethylsulfonioproprionate lyase family protein [Amphritea sp. 1_MG-2023]|uniref:dimethylsulfonioproprionate lyase family protein n=1 Tax=Amphritea sp. 1_MG-2023 TaxID=3062670 RepID=UPI0026E3F750|nr:dimethylsulfonioproprionate lyase family protein [Amphritea sp. 1_MG-2023]MDO6562304.1 dimethylsulfonioproprionate lyase family protein [Amphritea sp. 1_MG-2023]
MESQLGVFQRQLSQLLKDPVGLSSVGTQTAKTISQRLESAVTMTAVTPQENPLSESLRQVANRVNDLPRQLQPLVNSFFDIADDLTWFQRAAVNQPDFMAGHANAEIIGPRGLAVGDGITVGVTLMQPDLTYPDHHHPPEEIYLVLSEGLWWQQGQPWWSPDIGGYVYNPANIVHAMQSLDKPLFAIWCFKD